MIADWRFSKTVVQVLERPVSGQFRAGGELKPGGAWKPVHHGKMLKDNFGSCFDTVGNYVIPQVFVANIPFLRYVNCVARSRSQEVIGGANMCCEHRIRRTAPAR